MKSEQESPNSTGLKLSIITRTKSPLPGSVELGKCNRKGRSRENLPVAFIFLCTLYSLLLYLERVLISYTMMKMLGVEVSEVPPVQVKRLGSVYVLYCFWREDFSSQKGS